VVAMAEEHRAWCAVGIHPEAAGTADAGLEARLRTLAQAEHVVAIGEIGLDYYWESHPRPVQHDVFRRQLRLALELGLPVSIHNRDAGADAIAIVAEFPGVRGVFHSFLGTPDEARAVLDLGLFLGIGGPLTFKKGEALRETVRGVPLERIVLETDSPYLTPEPHRGKRNEPAYVRHVAEALAELKGVSPDAVARQTSANASALFGL